MKNNMKTTVLLTTHDMEEAEKLCDHVSIIHQGRIVVEGTPSKLKLKVSEKLRNPTFEDVFMEYTGVSFDEAEFQEEETA
jgi:ABC-2 type transport system ATP-binding protein